MGWILGDVSGSETLTAQDHLYESHVNQLRESSGATAVVGRTENCQYYCDGLADNVQIQQAVTAVHALGGGEIQLREGTYTFTGAVTLYENITIRGAGIGKTIIVKASGGDAFVIGSNGGTSSGTSDPAGTYSNLGFYDFEFDGGTTGPSLMALYAPENVRIERLYIHDGTNYGIYIANGNNVWVKDCIFKNLTGTNTQAAIQFKGVQYGWAVNNYVYNVAGGSGTQGIDSHATDGTYARNGKNNHILSNYVEECGQGINNEDNNSEIVGNVVINTRGQYGIGLRSNASNIVIARNTIDTAASGVIGISLANLLPGSSDIRIENNYIANLLNGSISDGIVAEIATNITVSNNTIKNVTRRGIFVRVDNVKIENNYIYDDQLVPTTEDAILLDTDISNAFISGNHCKNYITAGVRFNDANSNNYVQNNVFDTGLYGVYFTSDNDNLNNIIENNLYLSMTNLPVRINQAIGAGSRFSILNSDGNLGINITSPNGIYDLAGELSTSNQNARGIVSRQTFSGDGAGPGGMSSQPIFSPSANILDAYGLIGIAKGNPDTGVTIDNMYARFGRIDTGNLAGTVTNAFGDRLAAPSLGSIKPLNLVGYQIQNQGVAGMGTVVAIDVVAQSGATTNIGLRVDKSDTYAVQLLDTSGSVSGGITFGTDTNLYRGTANILKSDDTFDAAAFKVGGTVGASGSYTTADAKTVTVTNGIITAIV